ncbi:Hypothetical predicted protein [Olea europaea subsp. europaea]|uniref:Uncharacterized protein n=1 Tax=Olea europaea subsp. europaea TaxID=158383 RepID=A0A8S0U6N3_OLEEU|nr:Hypothetical predicted protein [Olea europaea subsp. europaea]
MAEFAGQEEGGSRKGLHRFGNWNAKLILWAMDLDHLLVASDCNYNFRRIQQVQQRPSPDAGSATN